MQTFVYIVTNPLEIQNLRKYFAKNTLLWWRSKNITLILIISRLMYNKNIRFGFCDIQNDRNLGKGYQPQPLLSADNPYLDLHHSGYHKNLIQ